MRKLRHIKLNCSKSHKLLKDIQRVNGSTGSNVGSLTPGSALFTLYHYFITENTRSWSSRRWSGKKGKVFIDT